MNEIRKSIKRSILRKTRKGNKEEVMAEILQNLVDRHTSIFFDKLLKKAISSRLESFEIRESYRLRKDGCKFVRRHLNCITYIDTEGSLVIKWYNPTMIFDNHKLIHIIEKVLLDYTA